ncbi:hypothetical protein [Priestia flexa]|uniref:hypothetical protein n=1 Tax=Priestia flexa TaxID=86664 RepID=UPI000473B12D|nr:hypothetical protein [Priestia flexa]
MASKRQRKKQQAKQNIKLLETVGFSRKEAEKVKNKPKQVTTIYKKEKRKRTANERSSILKSLGLKVSDHASKRYWSEKKWDAFVNEELAKKEKARKKEEQKKKRKERETGDRLFIYWTDPSGSADATTYYHIYKQIEHMTDGALIETAFWALDGEQPFGEVGDYDIRIAGDRSQKDLNEHFYSQGWVKTYEGKAKRMRPLLKTITAMLLSLYNHNQKLQFLYDLQDEINHFNPSMSKKIGDLFDL